MIAGHRPVVAMCAIGASSDRRCLLATRPSRLDSHAILAAGILPRGLDGRCRCRRSLQRRAVAGNMGRRLEPTASRNGQRAIPGGAFVNLGWKGGLARGCHSLYVLYPPPMFARKSGLFQDAGCQVAALAHLAIDGDLAVAGKFPQARAQLIDGNIHARRGYGPGRTPAACGRRRSNGRCSGGAARTASRSICGWSPRSSPAATKPAMLIGSLAEPYCGA